MSGDNHGYKEIFNVLRAAFIEYKTDTVRLVLLGAVATAIQALGLVALIPVLRRLAPGVEGGIPGVLDEWLTGSGFLIYVAVVVVLLALSVRLRYATFNRAYAVTERYVVSCAVEIALALARIFASSDYDKKTMRGALNRAIPSAPNACGLLLRQALIAVNDVLLVVFLLACLFVIAPLLGILSLLISIPFVVAFIRRFLSNTRLSVRASDNRRDMRKEKSDLFELLTSDSSGEASFCRELDRIFTSGPIGQSLSHSIELRRRIRGTSTIVELFGPATVFLLGILVYYADFLQLDLALIFVGYLILRQGTSALAHIADSMTTINRIYPDLRNYLDIIGRHKSLPESWQVVSDRDFGEPET